MSRFKFVSVSLVCSVIVGSAGCGFQGAASSEYQSAAQRYGSNAPAPAISEPTPLPINNQQSASFPNDAGAPAVATSGANSPTPMTSGSEQPGQVVTSPPAPGPSGTASGTATAASISTAGPVPSFPTTPAASSEEVQLLRSQVAQLERRLAQLPISGSSDSTSRNQAVAPRPIPEQHAEASRPELDRLIRDYRRKRTDFLQSEAAYDIEAKMVLVKAAEFLFRDTPLSFNVLPERSRFPFRELQDAAERVKPQLDRYVRAQRDSHGEDHEELVRLRDEVQSVIDSTAPGSGSRLLDWLESLKNLDRQLRDSESRAIPTN